MNKRIYRAILLSAATIFAAGMLSEAADAASPQKCMSGDNESHCVTIRQQGVYGHWHRYKLQNACKHAFNVDVLERRFKGQIESRLETHRIKPCEALSGHDTASWGINASLRWEWQNL